MAVNIHNTMDGSSAERFYSAYYKNQIQTGAGAPRYYKGSTWQRGHGFGSFMSSMLNFAKPIAKGLAKKGVKALAGVAGDILSGVPPKEAAKRRAVAEYEGMKANIGSKLIDTLGVRPSAKRRKKSVIKGRRSKKRSDVFGTY